MAILEGMASGLPLVATAVGDVPTLVIDGRTGILTPTEDVALLAEGIGKLLKDSDLRARYSDAARGLIRDEFSAERMTTDYLGIYKDAMASGKISSVRTSRPRAASGEKNEVKRIAK